MTETPPSRRELLAVGSPLPILAALALVVLAVVAAATVHPVLGAGLAVVGFGGAWIVTSRRRHDLDRERVRAEAHARARQPLAPPRPSSPAGTSSASSPASRSPFEGA